MLNFVCLKNFALLFRKIGAGAESKFYQELEPEPHENYAVPQHCNKK
jgi:hypothetical protein